MFESRRGRHVLASHPTVLRLDLPCRLNHSDHPFRDVWLPVLALIAAMASLCIGTSFAKSLFTAVGAQGTSAYRITVGALVLTLWFRPWRWRLNKQDALKILRYGATLGLMNLMFYMSLKTLPLGIAIAIEFTGPLLLSVFNSRKPVDFCWVVLALIGLLLLIPSGSPASSLDPVGVAYSLAASVFWVLYIIYGKAAGALPRGQSVPLGMLVGAALVIPFGVAEAGAKLLDPSLLLAGLGIGILASALPYSLEMVALKKLPYKTFGVLLSMEPAMGAVAAAIILNEQLTQLQSLAIACIVTASAGTAMTAGRSRKSSSTAASG